jgi:uncharacterized protein (UPF0332 family)
MENCVANLVTTQSPPLLGQSWLASENTPKISTRPPKNCQECAIIRQTITKDSIDIKITKENHRAHWQQAKEETSSSYSGLHFGCYMVRALMDYINHFHTLKAALLLHQGLVLKCWAQGLSIMLQKMFGCSLITKLCSILLMEADFNQANKQIYGIRMLLNARKHNLMQEEIYSKRKRSADDRTLTKVLTYNIIRQTQHPAGIALVDVDNCYDRIAPTIASMVFQAFGVSSTAVEAMLTTIQEMKFILHTQVWGLNRFCKLKIQDKDPRTLPG